MTKWGTGSPCQPRTLPGGASTWSPGHSRALHAPGCICAARVLEFEDSVTVAHGVGFLSWRGDGVTEPLHSSLCARSPQEPLSFVVVLRMARRVPERPQCGQLDFKLASDLPCGGGPSEGLRLFCCAVSPSRPRLFCFCSPLVLVRNKLPSPFKAHRPPRPDQQCQGV